MKNIRTVMALVASCFFQITGGRSDVLLGFLILLARSPSGCVAGQSECHQKVRQSFARDQADGKQQFSASSVRDEKDPVFLD